MDKRILDIGNARYHLNTQVLCDLVAQGRRSSLERQLQRGSLQMLEPEPSLGEDWEVERVYSEVMRLYREYARTGSLDVLVSLKCKLEEVSLRYKSLAVAEEVMSINRCLPYERRVKLD